jgi:hypothetical protein
MISGRALSFFIAPQALSTFAFSMKRAIRSFFISDFSFSNAVYRETAGFKTGYSMPLIHLPA